MLLILGRVYCGGGRPHMRCVDSSDANQVMADPTTPHVQVVLHTPESEVEDFVMLPYV
jgi:hypothetical protein